MKEVQVISTEEGFIIDGVLYDPLGEGVYLGHTCFTYKEIGGEGGIAIIPLWGTGGKAKIVSKW